MAERNSFCETIFLKELFLSYFGLFGWEAERNSFCKFCGMILTIEEDRIVRAFYLSWNIRNALKRSSILMKFSKIYILWSIIFRAGTTVCFFVFPFFFLFSWTVFHQRSRWKLRSKIRKIVCTILRVFFSFW